PWRPGIGARVVPPRRGTGGALRLGGFQPVRDRASLRFALPAAGEATIEVFDVMGRSTGLKLAATFSAGSHDVSLDANRLSPGVYAALLTAGGTRESIR